jgi:hypothetical protein
VSAITPVVADRRDPLIDTVRFFSTLYAGQTGIMELRTVPLEPTPEQRRIAWRMRDFVPVVQGKFNVHRIDQFIKQTTTRRMAAYFGVALRTQAAVTDRKGDAAHCQTLTALYVDADFKHVGEELTRKKLAEFPIPPSIIVNSGGGLHPYWLLRAPLDLQADYRGAQSILRRLAKGVADVVDESVSEPARVLRIPGSLNFKRAYGEPRLVVVEHM